MDDDDGNDVLTSLEAAREALVESTSAVLVQLLAAWRKVRAPAIADLIDVASKACRVGQESLVGAKEEHRAEWDRVANLRDPADLERLVEALQLRESVKTADRVLLLSKFNPNPHLSLAFAEHLDRQAYLHTKAGRLFWKRVEEALIATADVRIPHRIDPPMGTRSFKAAKKLWPTPRALTDAEKSVVAEISTRLGARTAASVAAASDGKDLLANVYAAPEDDAPRVVYGDWLLEQKDPRGEFIALQFERHAAGGKLSRGSGARERELLDKHWREWLGAALQWLKRTTFTFERGFLATAKIERWVGTLDQREWGTCRRLDFANVIASPDGVLYAIASSSHLTALRELIGLDARILERLATGKNEAGQAFHPKNLELIRNRITRIEAHGRHLAHDAMTSFPFPNLRELVFRGGGLPHYMFGGIVTNAAMTKLERFRHTDTTTGATFDLERDADGKLHQVRLFKPTEMAPARQGLTTMCKALDLVLVEDTS